MSVVVALAQAVELDSSEFVQRWERLEQQLAKSNAYLALLEEDPTTDEIPILIARNQLLRHKLELADLTAGEA